MISTQFSSKVGERYEAIRKGELEGLKNKEEMGTVTEQILKLIAEYEASKVLLAEQETLKEKLSLEYDNHFLVLKKGYIVDGCKPTEAKELANNDLQNTQMELIFIDEDIALLKANIHSIEYQLRLKYIQAKQEFKKNLALFDTFPYVKE